MYISWWKCVILYSGFVYVSLLPTWSVASLLQPNLWHCTPRWALSSILNCHFVGTEYKSSGALQLTWNTMSWMAQLRCSWRTMQWPRFTLTPLWLRTFQNPTVWLYSRQKVCILQTARNFVDNKNCLFQILITFSVKRDSKHSFWRLLFQNHIPWLIFFVNLSRYYMYDPLSPACFVHFKNNGWSLKSLWFGINYSQTGLISSSAILFVSVILEGKNTMLSSLVSYC